MATKMNGGLLMFRKNKDKYVSDGKDGAIGHIRNLLAKGRYKICPECGRIFPADVNYCSMCDNNDKLNNVIEIRIE